MSLASPSTRARRAWAGFSVACAVCGIDSLARAQYDAPASYYAPAAGLTGQSLKNALESIMTIPVSQQTNYGQVRDYLPFTDQNPDNPLQMFEVYTHVSIAKSATQVGFVGIYNSREHVWPDSLQGPGDTSNASKGSRGDIHMLKPLSSTVNNNRGSLSFGGANYTGSTGPVSGGYWFPGQSDKGDVARLMFYAATRYQSANASQNQAALTLVNGQSISNASVGDLDSLLHFNYHDVPDLFEQRRNDTIYRGDDVRTPGDDSAFGGTGNRNAFIDHPEYVWSVFKNQSNDTQLSVGNVQTDGSSTNDLSLGRVLRNAAVPGAQNVTLNKGGVDGTYYSVTTAGGATSTVNGRNNAFAMDTTGSRTLGVGLIATTAIAGLTSGTVTIDNLDVTTAGGAGHGANDGNDVINVSFSVLAPSNSSFAAATDVNTLTLDFDTLALNASPRALPFSIANLSSALGASLTASLDLSTITGSGDTARLSTNLAAFTNLLAGDARAFTASLSGTNVGDFTATYSLLLRDENLPGTREATSLTLALHGRVALEGDADYDNSVDFDDLLALARNYGITAGAAWSDGDFNNDDAVNFDDLLSLARTYGTTITPAQAAALQGSFAADWSLAQAIVPEPTVATLIGASLILRRRRHSASN